jgi:signal transduction histidine kinase
MRDVVDVDRTSILEDLCGRLGIGLIVCDTSDHVVWTNARVRDDFPHEFTIDAAFTPALEQLILTAGAEPTDSDDSPVICRRGAEHSQTEPSYFRLRSFPLGDDERVTVHSLIEMTSERELEESLHENLDQLASMREMIDTLYGSLGTQEVLYLILIAVTAGRGFGFNRAFYLQATGDHLRGKMGIGPSSHEDAHRIWQHFDEQNLSTLRGIYQNMTKDGKTPDFATNEIASRMELRLDLDDSSCLVHAIREREPTLIHRGDAAINEEGVASETDRVFFELFSTDAIAVVPLYVQDELAGVLIADNFVTAKPITDRDLSVLKTFSRYAGVALERSRLLDELGASVANLQEANANFKRHQQRLIDAEKLSALGKMAAEVTHEIRNPLAIIGGHARFLLSGDEHTEDDRESLGIIVEEVDRLEKYLCETLDFARSDAAGSIRVDLRAAIETCVAPMRRELDERSITISLELGDEPLHCCIEPDAFHRAVGNLLKNSVEAIGECGFIHLSASRTAHTAQLRLADSGGGIPPDLHDRIFDPFFTTKPEGTGLGTSIASESVHSLGGRISLQADEQFRSIFIIELPLDECDAREADSVNSPPETKHSP